MFILRAVRQLMAEGLGFLALSCEVEVAEVRQG